MSTDHTSGIPPLDGSSIDTGAFASESAFSVDSKGSFMAGGSGLLTEASNDFRGDRPIEGAMEFRVIRSGLPVRRLRLTGNRYTFGSAEGCSIQLIDPSLRPMHAALIRDTNRILVRAYSVPIEWNDTRTIEASLQAGDVIRLGAYSFELLSTSASKSDPTFRSSPALSASAQDDSTMWREQLRREVAQWRARQAECDRREGRCADQETVLRNRESELWTRAEQLHRRESHLMAQESAALQIQEDYASKQQELIRLRDEHRATQETYEARETEFRNLEQEYREHVEEASRQLQQSQQQAEVATQAVQRMREQFADLNQQLQELQDQQSDLQQREEQQTSEHQRLRLELEAAHDEALDGRDEEIVRRQEIEVRMDEMDAQRREAQAAYEAERKRSDESDEVAEKLREQVAQLHENIRHAGDEATQLRKDYEQACDSVRSLEAIIEQGNTRGEMDRESWYGEAEELRQSVEQLSIDLARANGELGDLRKANDELSDRLSGLTRERDEALDEAKSRPTQDAFESLREELNDANHKIAEMQRDYEETLARLESTQTESVQNAPVAEHHQESTGEPSLLDAEGVFPAAAVAWASSDHDPATGQDQGVVEATDLSDLGDLHQDVGEPSQPWPAYEAEAGVEAEVGADGEVGIEAEAGVEAEAGANGEVGVEAEAGVEADVDASPDESLVLESDTQGEPELDSPQPESQGFGSSPWQHDSEADDAPQWSTEPMQNTDAPHFETGESDAWDTPDSEPQNRIEAFEAEFDRAGESDSTDDRFAGDSESVDNAIDLIEKNVDDAMGVDVPEETDPHGQTPDDQRQQNQASPWGFAGNDDAETTREADNDSDVKSPWNSNELLSDEEPAVETDNALVSPWQPAGDSELTSGHCEDNTSGQFEDNTSGQFEDNTSGHCEDDDSLRLGDGGESIGLADQLISDLGSSTEESGDAQTNDPTDSWEKTEPFSGPVDGEASSSGYGWDQEYPEESRSSEWTNDPGGERTELIRDSSIESILETPLVAPTDSDQPIDFAEPMGFAQSSDDDVANALVDSVEAQDDQVAQADEEQPLSSEVPASEAAETSQSADDDDSIEAYMNRLLNRVQGSSESETTTTVSTPLVATANTEILEQSGGETTTVQSSETVPLVESDAPLVPRSQAPERNSNLSAMRELANQSARTAVAHSVRIQARDTQIKAMMEFVKAGIAGICAIAFYMFLDWPVWLKLLGVGAILVIACVLVREGLVLLQEVHRRLHSADSDGGEANQGKSQESA